MKKYFYENAVQAISSPHEQTSKDKTVLDQNTAHADMAGAGEFGAVCIVERYQR